MRGLSLPELERLQVLANWLNMDLDLFFGNGKSRQRSLIVDQNSPSSPKSEPKLDHLQTTLLALVDKMSVANQQLILKLAEELSHSSQATGGPATARP